MLDRRDFLAHTALALAAASLPTRAAEPMRLLILGGTGFLGPHTVRRALERGHEMTLFNRGRTNDHLFPELEKLRGDRDGGLEALKGRQWDAVVDTSGYVPRLVRDSATLLAPHVGQYVFISSISVYASFATPGMDETAPVGTLEDPTVETITGATYGPLKALCEQAAEAAMPDRTAVIRPGLIAGPGDRTDRFTYWPVRVARGGEVLAPPAADPVQFIDVRDLANFIVHLVETGRTEVYNADRPAASLTIGGLMKSCRTAGGSDARFHHADARWLAANGVRPWSDLPAWLPASGDTAGFGSISTDRAAGAGLAIRSAEKTARDTLAWFRTLPDERQNALKAGLAPDRETELLAMLDDSTN